MDNLSDEVAEFVEPELKPFGPNLKTWFKTQESWVRLGCDGAWKHNRLRLRMVRLKVTTALCRYLNLDKSTSNNVEDRDGQDETPGG